MYTFGISKKCIAQNEVQACVHVLLDLSGLSGFVHDTWG